VEIICDDFFIPNVFAPGNGGDPENDCFRLYGTNCISELNFRIYNRWGELVFETNDPEICWDGTFHGQEQNAGVFVYYLKAKLINEESIEKQGNITLIR
ncbi:MAG TPA: gliding motility-associated C-terminal domain-containing protein, partial [Flavobacteriales bacterium]|nr:gliding motility-associated C-terminal domain-containing protein [Flavobacteriales bacterium]